MASRTECQRSRLYHVTAGKWNGADLVPAAVRVERGWETEDDLRAAWESRYNETYSNRQWAEIMQVDAWEVHFHATLSDATDYRSLFCPGGSILAVLTTDLDVRIGTEYPHPVVRGTVPACYVTEVGK